jgi:DcmR-like sensory protein
MAMEHSHSLCLLEGESSFPALYDMINQYLSDGYAVIYSVESNPDDVVLQMTNLGMAAENFVQKGALRLLNKNLFLLPDNKAHNQLLNSLQLVTAELTEFKWILCIGSNDRYLEINQRENLLEYEKALSFPGLSLEIVCCYNAELVKDLCLEYLVKILNLHQYTLHHHHSQFVYREWNPKKLTELLAKTMNKAIGQESSDRLLNILKTLYKIDDGASFQFQNFDNLIRQLLGNSANVILNSLAEEIKREISFSRGSQY